MSTTGSFDDAELSVPAVLWKKMIIMQTFFYFKLCKIAPKFDIIMQTVQKY